MKDLFGQDSFPDSTRPVKGMRPAEVQHKQLIAIYGKTEGKCKNCIHLIRKRYDKVYLKCELSKQSNSEGTDWRAGWQACGKFEPEIKKQ